MLERASFGHLEGSVVDSGPGQPQERGPLETQQDILLAQNNHLSSTEDMRLGDKGKSSYRAVRASTEQSEPRLLPPPRAIGQIARSSQRGSPLPPSLTAVMMNVPQLSTAFDTSDFLALGQVNSELRTFTGNSTFWQNQIAEREAIRPLPEGMTYRQVYLAMQAINRYEQDHIYRPGLIFCFPVVNVYRTPELINLQRPERVLQNADNALRERLPTIDETEELLNLINRRIEQVRSLSMYERLFVPELRAVIPRRLQLIERTILVTFVSIVAGSFFFNPILSLAVGLLFLGCVTAFLYFFHNDERT